MKIAFVAALVFFAAEMALAEEVHLELQNIAFNKLADFQAYDNDVIRQSAVSAPEGIKAPPGDIRWFQIMLGSKTYFAAMYMENNSVVRYLIDRNCDKDLGNEKDECIVKNRNSQLINISALPGVFSINGTDFASPLNLKIFTYMQNIISVYTSFRGKINVKGRELEVKWTPGFDPEISGREFSAKSAYIGATAVEMGKVAIKESKPVAAYKIREDKLVFRFPAPKGIDYVFAAMEMESNGSPFVLAYPDNGFISFPKVNYDAITLHSAKTMNSAEYSVFCHIAPVEINESFVIKPLEPLSLVFNVKPVAGADVEFSASVVTAEKIKAFLNKDGEQLPFPVVSVKTADGKEVYKFTFKAG